MTKKLAASGGELPEAALVGIRCDRKRRIPGRPDIKRPMKLFG
jgi:hypothetical protein